MDVKSQKKMDWQVSVKRNTFYSYLLVFSFFLASFGMGFVMDVVFNKYWLALDWWLVCKQLATFQLIAYATYGLLLVGLVGIVLLYFFHRRLMLTGLNTTAVLKLNANETSHPLNDLLITMSKKMGLSHSPKLFIAHTPVLNAFVSGFSAKNSMMVLSQGLLEALEPKEIQAIMLMQLSQLKALDQRLTLVLAFVSNFFLIVFDLVYHAYLYGKNRDRDPNPLIKFFFSGLKVVRFIIPAMTFIMRFVLRPERIVQAQQMTVKVMSDNEPLANAIKKINDIQFEKMESLGEAYSEMALDEIRREAYVFDPADISKCQTFASPFTTHPSLDEQLEAMGYYN